MEESQKKETRPIVITEENAVVVGEALGRKLGEIGDKTAAEVNALTERFGIIAKIQIVLLNKETGELL